MQGKIKNRIEVPKFGSPDAAPLDFVMPATIPANQFESKVSLGTSCGTEVAEGKADWIKAPFGDVKLQRNQVSRYEFDLFKNNLFFSVQFGYIPSLYIWLYNA
jgi:hypothetical protein